MTTMEDAEKTALVEGMISCVIRSLVDKPEAVIITQISNQGQNTVVFGLQVDKGDLGKVIGKAGRNANALRILINAVASKHGVRALLDIGNAGVGFKRV